MTTDVTPCQHEDDMVDEARGDEPPARVDHTTRSGGVHLADRGDAVTVDRDIGGAGRCTRSIDDRPAPDHQFVCHMNPRSTDRVWQLVRRGTRVPPR
jgi:hypothetical protein